MNLQTVILAEITGCMKSVPFQILPAVNDWREYNCLYQLIYKMCVWEMHKHSTWKTKCVSLCEFRKPQTSKKKPAAAGWKWTLVHCTLPCCYRSLMLSDDGLNDWNTYSICHQLVEPTHNQFSDWITGAGRRYEKWSVSLDGPTPLSSGHPDEWLNRRKGALANQQTITLLNECYANEASCIKTTVWIWCGGECGYRCVSVHVHSWSM